MTEEATAPVRAPSSKEQFRVVDVNTKLRPTKSTFQRFVEKFGPEDPNAFASNRISTAKYNAVTFLPVNLFEQFCRVANLYFLLVAILQLIPGLSPTSWFTTVCPLVIVLAINAVKEGVDDYHRHKSDDEINNREVEVLRDSSAGGPAMVGWHAVEVGDIVKVLSDQEVPADLVLLSTADPEKLCYVETANLDGETNLKIKYAYPGTGDAKGIDDLEKFASNSSITCETPNPRLYVFEGYVEDATSKEKEPLTADNLLLRGCVLKKTSWVIGLVVFTGKDSKIMRNQTKAPRKITRLERHMNVLVIAMFFVQLLISLLLAVGDQVWQRNQKGAHKYYLSRNTQDQLGLDLKPGFAGWVIQVLRFIVLLNQMIPISLYVTLEIVKVFQCSLLYNKDLKMYHPETDTPFVCRTTTLNEELGQVEYVLSDKTGTLTQNVMGFVWASIEGTLYGQNTVKTSRNGVPINTPHSIALDPELHRELAVQESLALKFMVNLAVCNTVIPSKNDNGEYIYQASSPDEEALVQAAAYLNIRLLSRSTDKVEIDCQGKLLVYEVLAVLEFNSDRKRMSIITYSPHDDKIRIFCKGADSIIMARVKQDDPSRQVVQAHLDEMAQAGFRTLCISERELTPAEYEAWNKEFQEASVALSNREEKVAAVSEKIEKDLDLVGATAVEDKLQDGVPDCIAQLAASGIKVWVLTGDKVETAISISRSCRLFVEDMPLVELRESDFKDKNASEVLSSKMGEVRSHTYVSSEPSVGVVIEGGALAVALRQEHQEALLQLCTACKAVVCCRVSPMQKAQVTKLVKDKAGAVTLGIGDGANDVGMIQAAHIGVGISGREGRAAVLASDFSFAQFRYLSRLLLVHGRWAYKRNSEVVQYAFYKNWAYCLPYVYLAFVSGFSCQPIFTTALISSYNVCWTSFPTVAFALLEQDVTEETLALHPKLYLESMLQTRWSFFMQVGRWMLEATWHSLVVFFIPMYAMSTANSNGISDDLMTIGTAIYTAVIITVNLKIAFRTHYWTWLNFILIFGVSIGLWFPALYILSNMWKWVELVGISDASDISNILYPSTRFWLAAVILAPALSILLDISIVAICGILNPTYSQLCQELELEQHYRKKILMQRETELAADRRKPSADGA